MTGMIVLVVGAMAAAPVPAAAQDIGAIVAERVVEATERALGVREVRRVYQGRATETETFSRRVTLGRDGRLLVQNVAGDITVSAGSGDEVSIEAVKRTRRGREALATVTIEVDERPGRVEVRTSYPRRRGRDNDNDVSVDFTITVPASTEVEARSVSGSVRVNNVQGVVRGQSVSGSVTLNGTPRVELARSLSGNVELTGAAESGDLAASSVSGNVVARGIKARELQLSSISGNIIVTDASCERLEAKTVSGDLEYGGPLTRNGRYDLNSHSGNVRLSVAGNTGFELTAASFSGDVRSDIPATIGGRGSLRDGRGRRDRSIRATVGDASAVLTIRTFSGDVVIMRAR